MAPSALETMVPLSVPSDLSDRSDLSDQKLVDLLTCRLVDFYRTSGGVAGMWVLSTRHGLG